ncbi:MAG: hybrid sensor histidine kinase/response regulator [Myxococcaceae bacterium]
MLAAVAEVLGPRLDSDASEALRARVQVLAHAWAAEAEEALNAELTPVVDAIVAVASFEPAPTLALESTSSFGSAVASGLKMLSEEITAHMARERELAAKLMHADRLAVVGQLSAGVAHEVNNPATYLIANLELLKERELKARSNDDSLELIEECLEGVQRIVGIVKDLRAYARTEVEDEPVLLDDVLRLAAKTVAKTVRYRARLDLELDAPVPTMGNRARLTQVFINLLVNAAQAIPEGRPEHHQVKVKSFVDGQTLVASVSDTGLGMSAEVQRRVFQPFFTTKSLDQGTGLGLSLSAEIVRQHGGTLSFVSKEGVGTTFEARFPIRALSLVKTRPPAAAPTSRPKVLVVDDDRLVLKSYQRSLGRDFELTTAEGGEEALSLVREHTFDVVLCDLMMPAFDGPAVYEAVIQVRPELAHRFLFVSGGAFTARTRAFMEKLGERLLEKPIEVARVREAVVRLLSAPR